MIGIRVIKHLDTRHTVLVTSSQYFTLDGAHETTGLICDMPKCPLEFDADDKQEAEPQYFIVNCALSVFVCWLPWGKPDPVLRTAEPFPIGQTLKQDAPLRARQRLVSTKHRLVFLRTSK
jgi:hypothetical protein